MPTVISLVPDSESQEGIKKYCEENNIRQKGKFHSTMLYSGHPFFEKKDFVQEINKNLPLVISPPYSLDIFENQLVMVYDSEKAKDFRKIIMDEALRQMMLDYPDLNDRQRKMLGKADLVLTSIDYKKGVGEVLNVATGKRYPKFFDSKFHITFGNSNGIRVGELPPFEREISFSSLEWKLDF